MRELRGIGPLANYYVNLHQRDARRLTGSIDESR